MKGPYRMVNRGMQSVDLGPVRVVVGPLSFGPGGCVRKELDSSELNHVRTIEQELDDAKALVLRLQRVIREHAHDCKAFAGQILESLWEIE